MTEKQRSDAGLPYFPGDEELRALRARCKQLCYAFNTTEHQQREERINLLRQLLGSTNGRFLIEPSFWCDYGYNIHLGKNFYANHNCVILDCAKVTFGRPRDGRSPTAAFILPVIPLTRSSAARALSLPVPSR